MIKFYDRVFFRHPSSSTSAFERASDFPSLEAFLRERLADPDVLEAIQLSSPDFKKQIDNFLRGDEHSDPKKKGRFVVSALKYLNRKSYRPTPFGTFTACGLVGIGSENASERIDAAQNTLRRVARLDMSYLAYFAETLAAHVEVRPHIRYFPNNTILTKGAKSRYVEFTHTAQGRSYNLSAFTCSEYIDVMLNVARGAGATRIEIAKVILGEDVTESEALAFVDQLIEARILVSELEPIVVGENYANQLLGLLARWTAEAGDAAAATFLRPAAEYLENLMSICRVADTDARDTYAQLDAAIRQRHGQSFPHQIQVDTFTPGPTTRLPFEWGRQIQRGIKAMARLCDVYPNTRLATFRKQFYERYEEALVPLLEVLDPELGIGFAGSASEQYTYAPLVDGVPVVPRLRKQNKVQIEWNQDIQQFLMTKICAAQRTGAKIIQLSDDEIEQFSYDLQRFPPTFSAMVSVLPRAGEKPLISFHEHGKDSASALIGRFTHLHPDVEKLLREITAFEDRCYPGKVVAEVNHLSEFRVGNITQRPRTRRYEIPYVSNPGATDGEGTITAEDILVGIRGGKIRLYSKRLNKEIIPRLSNAHNYSHNSLPVYRFLASLQEEHDGGYYEFSINLGHITKMVNFIPRIQYENFVLRPASWTITTHAIKKFKNFPFPEFRKKLLSYFAQHDLPTIFRYFHKGSPLHIDLSNPAGIKLFAELLGRHATVSIEEVPWPPRGGEALINKGGEPFTHEIIVPFRNEYFLDRAEETVPDLRSDVSPRNYLPGDKWLYFKLYAGVNATEKIVSQRLPMLFGELKSSGAIDRAFYLRFQDEGGHHLRFRMRATETGRLGEVLVRTRTFFQSEIQDGYVWKLQIDTYQRELERYGAAHIEAAEAIFDADSALNLRLKSLLVAELHQQHDYLLPLCTMQIYLDAFFPDAADQRAFLKERQQAFFHTFNTNKLQKREMTLRYKDKREMITEALAGRSLPFERAAEFAEALYTFKARLAAIAENELAGLSRAAAMDYVASYIHMSVLRFVKCKNKKHEHLLFFFLDRHHLQGTLRQRAAGRPVARSKAKQS